MCKKRALQNHFAPPDVDDNFEPTSSRLWSASRYKLEPLCSRSLVGQAHGSEKRHQVFQNRTEASPGEIHTQQRTETLARLVVRSGERSPRRPSLFMPVRLGVLAACRKVFMKITGQDARLPTEWKPVPRSPHARVARRNGKPLAFSTLTC